MTEWCMDCGRAHIGPCRSIFGGVVPDFIIQERRRKRAKKYSSTEVVLISDENSKSNKVHIQRKWNQTRCGIKLSSARQVWSGDEIAFENLKEEYNVCGRCASALKRKIARDKR